jgi:hypothetical protein
VQKYEIFRIIKDCEIITGEEGGGTWEDGRWKMENGK